MPISFFSVGETISTVLSSTMFMNWSYPERLRGYAEHSIGLFNEKEASKHAHHVSVSRKLEILGFEKT